MLDPWFLHESRVGVNRLQFLLESLADLDSSLAARGSRLIVLRGRPAEVLPRLIQDWGVTQLCFEHDTEPFAKARDAEVRALCAAAGVDVHSPVSHTLYDPADLLRRSPGGRPPLTMKSFEKLVDSVGAPPAPAAAPPASLPAIPPEVRARCCPQ